MKKLKMIFSFSIFLLISCKHEVILCPEEKGIHQTCKDCADISISKLIKHNKQYEVQTDFSSWSDREPIHYPGLILRDKNGNQISYTSFNYYMQSGMTNSFQFTLPDSLIEKNEEWCIELVQIHKEDSIICSRSFTQLLKD